PEWRSPPLRTRKISSRLSGVLTANRYRLSGDIASGRTWPLSKSVKGEAEEATAGSRGWLPEGGVVSEESAAVNANATRAMSSTSELRYECFGRMKVSSPSVGRACHRRNLSS